MRLLAVALVVAMTGCATGYSEHGFGGGFSETQLDKNVWRVSFNGNGWTPGERATDFAMLRAAELTLAHGYHYFGIAGTENTSRFIANESPTYTRGSVDGYGNFRATSYGGATNVIEKPGRVLTVVAFVERPDNAQGMTYDARFVADALSAKYGIELESQQPEPKKQETADATANFTAESR